MMSTRQSSLLRTPATSGSSFDFGRSGLLQRKCACGKAAGPAGECEECKKKRKSGAMSQPKDIPSSAESPSAAQTPRFGYSFDQVPVHAGSQAAKARGGLHMDGISVHPAPEENAIFMNDPPKAPPEPKPEPKPEPAKPAPACPPKIEVAGVYQADLSEDNVKAGFLTGAGGVAELRVSDPSGKDWDGTTIHENLTPKTNTCPGLPNCTNTHGAGGAGGSTWKVGEGTSGMVTLPAKKNTIYDLHIAMTKTNVLKDAGLDSCVQTCEQFFDCPGGGRIGTGAFTIRRDFKKGTVGGKDVTLVTLSVS